MKKICIIGSVFCLLFSCNTSDDSKNKAPENTASDTAAAIAGPPADTFQTVVNPSIVWTVESNDNGSEKLHKPENRLDNLSAEELIKLLNENYPDIQLELIKTSHDTVYVSIPDSRKLTEGIGDTGAQNYIASVTYTLTETKKVRFVNFKFKRGDHAEPGVYSREDFTDLR